MNIEILEDYFNKGLSTRDVAKAEGVSQSTVKHWAKKHGLRSQYAQCIGRGPRAANCVECGETDPEQFYGTQKSQCKKCFNSMCHKIGLEKKQKAIGVMGGACCSCGYDRYYGALEFHHVDRETKDGDWRGLRNWGWARIEQELQKCILVCSTCHAEIHGGLIDDTQYPMGPRIQ